MRPIRLLILLLAVALALVLALVQPLQGRADRTTGRQRGHRHRVHRRLHERHSKHRPRQERRSQAGHDLGHRVVAYARHFLGVRYSWGGTSPRTGFDCSGLVRFVYGHFGITLPHSSFADLAHGRHVLRRALRPGDLVFFAGASHVGIYVGGGRFIDAPRTGTDVRISSLHGWYGASYYGARRFH